MSKVTKQQIEEWKAKYGDVYEFPIEDKVAYLKSPNMQDYKRAFSAMQSGGDVDYFETLLESLFIGGDVEVKKDDNYFLPAKKELMAFFKYDDAEITKEGNKYKIVIDGHVCECRKVNRQDLRIAERKNKVSKPFVTQEKLFEMICISKDEAYEDRNNAEIRFPLYKAIEEIQNEKIGSLKKL